MKKLILFLGLFLTNNAFAHGGAEFFIIFLVGTLLLALFHIFYVSILTAKSPKGKKLNTFIWSFFLPPLFWIILIGGGVSIYIIFVFTLVIPVGLYYFMKKQNFFNDEQK